jgi:hypothetical protein
MAICAGCGATVGEQCARCAKGPPSRLRAGRVDQAAADEFKRLAEKDAFRASEAKRMEAKRAPKPLAVFKAKRGK